MRHIQINDQWLSKQPFQNIIDIGKAELPLASSYSPKCFFGVSVADGTWDVIDMNSRVKKTFLIDCIETKNTILNRELTNLPSSGDIIVKDGKFFEILLVMAYDDSKLIMVVDFKKFDFYIDDVTEIFKSTYIGGLSSTFGLAAFEISHPILRNNGLFGHIKYAKTSDGEAARRLIEDLNLGLSISGIFICEHGDKKILKNIVDITISPSIPKPIIQFSNI